VGPKLLPEPVTGGCREIEHRDRRTVALIATRSGVFVLAAMMLIALAAG
jgi:hypothetical protein